MKTKLVFIHFSALSGLCAAFTEMQSVKEDLRLANMEAEMLFQLENALKDEMSLFSV